MNVNSSRSDLVLGAYHRAATFSKLSHHIVSRLLGVLFPEENWLLHLHRSIVWLLDHRLWLRLQHLCSNPKKFFCYSHRFAHANREVIDLHLYNQLNYLLEFFYVGRFGCVRQHADYYGGYLVYYCLYDLHIYPSVLVKLLDAYILYSCQQNELHTRLLIFASYNV